MSARLTEEEIDKARIAFLEFDKDNSGSIDQVANRHIVLRYTSLWWPSIMEIKESVKLWHLIFYVFDFIQFELKQVLEHMRIKVTDADVFQMISEVDDDHSGAIGGFQSKFFVELSQQMGGFDILPLL